MNFLRKLFGIEDEPEDYENSISMDFFYKAYHELKNHNFGECLLILQDAINACRSKEELIYLFGLYRSAPAAPQGIAGLADYCIVAQDSIEDSITILHLIDRYFEDDFPRVCLCEVWSSIFQRAIETKKYEMAKYAYYECLNSQRCQGNERLYRIDRDQLWKYCDAIARGHSNDADRMNEIKQFSNSLREIHIGFL